MKINILKGRLGKHRFHSMLVHFPSGLYPFSLIMDFLCGITGNPAYAFAATYSLLGAVATSVVAIIYGAIDFLEINSASKPWKAAVIHAVLNVSWFIVFSSLLFYRLNHGNLACGWIYLGIMGCSTIGLFFSNYLGADLIIKHRVGMGNLEED